MTVFDIEYSSIPRVFTAFLEILPGAAREKRRQLYQEALNQIKDEMLQKTIKNLDDRSAANRTEAEPTANPDVASLPNERPDSREHLHHFLEVPGLNFSYELVVPYLCK